MRRILLVAVLLILFSLAPGEAFIQAVQAVQEADQGGYAGLPLCLPGMPANGRCLMYGPAQVVQEMKAAGFTFPPRPLPAATPPSELGVMPVMVARINAPEENAVPIFSSFQDAASGVNPTRFLDPGRLRFVRFINQANDADGKVFVQLTTGEWMRATPASYPRFQGLEFFDNPTHPFGWIIAETEVYSAPSFQSPKTGTSLFPYKLITVYETVEAEGYFWYRISPDEWVNNLRARVVILRPTPPEGVTTNRWIELDLFQQTLMVYEDGQLLFATLTTTGREPYFTRPGLFTIYSKIELAIMSGAFEADRSDYYHLEAVPWQLYYDESRAIHTAYWHTMFGFEGSAGCVNLSPGDAHWVYLWANEGDYVWVHDTSGRTPTDPSLYGPGAP